MRYEKNLIYRSPCVHLAAKGVLPNYENGRHQDEYNHQERDKM
jgi:hypothetical protein